MRTSIIALLALGVLANTNPGPRDDCAVGLLKTGYTTYKQWKSDALTKCKFDILNEGTGDLEYFRRDCVRNIKRAAKISKANANSFCLGYCLDAFSSNSTS